MAKEKTLSLNEFEIEGKIYKLKYVKMKDIKDGFYDNFLAISGLGFVRTVSYEDGEEIIINFLNAVCENSKDVKTIADNLTAKSMSDILKKVKEMNELNDIEDLIKEKNE